ncbi:general secretion pathway protein GspK [Acetobacter sacchari]|uniref:General secretion pathway protein GspK n=1 Tax=Acetobacter sacchari TaxID=2661687 RepID=A0ABS3LVG0_9PROT|nr:type II secretion system protein GspK [Acetobacter sacchari]MBO1359907.1 general secretion pathway protein GspK [Acetobacter sacchari]
MTDPRDTRRGEEGGFALLLVLWMLGFLALLVSQTLSTGRAALRLGDAALERARLETMADAAITTELFSVATGVSGAGGVWKVSGDEKNLVQVRSIIERNKINPNAVSVTLMQALLVASGTPPDKATVLANAIFAWKNPDLQEQAPSSQGREESRCVPLGAPFHTFDDLAVVPGMTRSLAQALAPHMSFAQMQPTSSLTRDPVVRAALVKAGLVIPGQAIQREDVEDEEALVVVDAKASGDGGAMLRHAEVVLLPDARPVPWRVMRWETSDIH